MGRNVTTCDWISLGSRLSSFGHCSVVRTVIYSNFWPMCHEYKSMISKQEKVSHTACITTARVAEDLQHRVKITVTSEVPEGISLEWAQPKHTTHAQAKPAPVGW